MRLRNVKNAASLLAAHPEWLILEGETRRGSWKDVFSNDHPIHLEIGCGKGRFLTEMARQHPEINFLGMEKFDSVIVRALQKVLMDPLPNLRLLRADAVNLETLFAPGEIRTLYLNFSDPWPKPSHSRRRLTSPEFIARYRMVLPAGAPLYFKTDNFPLFSFSMKSFVDSGLAIDRISLDLHRETDIPNIESEFESRFVAMGNPIYYLKAALKESK